MLRNAEDAMDVTQWTYIRAFETGFEVRSRGEALSWLYSTATRRCLAFLRDETNRRRIRGENTQELRGSPVPSAEGQVVGRDLLRRALAQVSEQTGQVALMSLVQGHSVERTAELMGISVRTVARDRRRFEHMVQTLLKGEQE